MSRCLLLLIAGCVLDDTDLDRDGYSGFSDDCDDRDPAIHPQATETVGDGIDQDCDGHDAVLQVVGEVHSCLLDDLGAIHCSGSNSRGQLDAPAGSWEQIAAGAFHTCALNRAGDVHCWGDNRFGQTDVPDLSDATWVGATESASLALTDRTMICWGACITVP